MTWYKFADRASPPLTEVPSGYDGIGGYIGGDKAVNIWPNAAWHIGAFDGKPKMPYYVPDEAVGISSNPTKDAFDLIQRAYRLGIPKGKVLILDMETFAYPKYVTNFWNVVRWAGYRLWVYGSRSTVFRNPACDGYAVADYTSEPHLLVPPAGSTGVVRAVQYANAAELGRSWDASVVKYWQQKYRLWR